MMATTAIQPNGKVMAHVAPCWPMGCGWRKGSGCGWGGTVGGLHRTRLAQRSTKSSLSSTRNTHRFVPEEDKASAALQKQCSRLRKRPTCSKSDALVYAKPLFSESGVHTRGPKAMAAIDILLHTIVRSEVMLGAPLQNMASRLHEMHTFRKTRFPSTPKPYFWRGTTSIISDSPELHSKNIEFFRIYFCSSGPCYL
jgi:hypothetical protein